jgi:hypothetical protein
MDIDVYHQYLRFRIAASVPQGTAVALDVIEEVKNMASSYLALGTMDVVSNKIRTMVSGSEKQAVSFIL